MKIFIDKQGGSQYHKEDCVVLLGRVIHAKVGYTPVALTEAPTAPMAIEGITYYPCPYCFNCGSENE